MFLQDSHSDLTVNMSYETFLFPLAGYKYREAKLVSFSKFSELS